MTRSGSGSGSLAGSFALSMLAVLFVACAAGSPPPSAPNDKLGEVVRFALQPSDGGDVVSVPVAGARATVVGVFGPQCGRCKSLMPALVAKQVDLARQGAKLVLVATLANGQTADDAKRALASWGVSTPFLVDKDGTTQRETEFEELPATIVFDRAGKMSWIAPEGASADDVLAAAR